jgi:hypothetical protein
MVALPLVVLMAASGCERSGEAGPPAAAQVADRTPADPAPAIPDAIERTPPVVSAPVSALNIRFDPPELNFGYIPPNVNKTGTITVLNEGNAPVKILTMKSTCKCTTLSDLAGKVIPPGGSVPVTAELEGRDMSGGRKASIRFVFEGYDDVLSVDLRAEVSLPVRTSPAIFNMASGTTTGHVVVESLDGGAFEILAAHGQPPRYVGFDPEIDDDEPRSSYVLEWDLTVELAEGRLPHWWVIETNDPTCPLVDAWVRHRMTIEMPVRARHWRIAEKRNLLGVLAPGQPAEFTAKVTDIGRGSIYGVRSLSRDFVADLLSFELDGDDGVCTVRITPRADLRGVFQGSVEFMGRTYTHSMDVVGKIKS